MAINLLILYNNWEKEYTEISSISIVKLIQIKLIIIRNVL